MLCSLLAYDDDGNVIATLDHMVARDADGNVVGLIDFDAHETAGGEHTDIWQVEGAKGSKTWPEWLGAGAHDFKVELEGKTGKKRLAALVHKESGHRRERADIDARIADRVAKAKPGQAVDIRDIVGGPDRPLALHSTGATKGVGKATRAKAPAAVLPFVANRAP